MNKKNLLKIVKQELTILSDFINGFEDIESIHPKEVELAVSKAKDIYNELLLLKGEEVESEPIVKQKIQAHAPIANRVEVQEKSMNLEPMIKSIEEPFEILDRNESQAEIEQVSHYISITDLTEKSVERDTEDIKVEEALVVKDEKLEIASQVIEHEEKEKPAEKIVEVVDIEEKTVEPVVKKDTSTEKVSNTKEKLAVKEEKAVGEIMADKFSKDKLSINEMLAGVKRNKDLASLLKESPITDLKKAIKLNDRIWFINELFNKNAATFERAIDAVNNAADLDKALEYLFTNFKWDQERKSTISFLELVFRRFASK